MKFVPVESIQVGKERFRRELSSEGIQSLAASIEANGLIHPLVVTSESSPTLIAGQRRLLAIKSLYEAGKPIKMAGREVPPGTVPVIVAEDVGPIQAMEIELEENVRRKDLTWQEECAAVAKLHEMRMSQGDWSIAKTAEELAARGASITNRKAVADSIILARHIEENPNSDVAKALTRRDAFKRLLREQEQFFRGELAKLGGSKHPDLEVIQGDAVEVLAGLQGEQFDVILTDPPYGIGADSFNYSLPGRLDHHYDDDPDVFVNLISSVSYELYRVARPQAHLYMCCDVRMFHVASTILGSAGWSVWLTPFVWVKDMGYLPDHDCGHRRCYETILYAHKGRRKTLVCKTDVLAHKVEKDRLHHAQKPVSLFVDLLERSVVPGDYVLDPFCGTGTSLVAAKTLSCRALGIELDPACVQIARDRIAAL